MIARNVLQLVTTAPSVRAPDVPAVPARWGVEMRHNDRVLDEVEDQAAADRQTASLAGVAFTLLLLVVGLFLVHELHHKAMIEDCLLSGRNNCDMVVARLNNPTYPR